MTLEDATMLDVLGMHSRMILHIINRSHHVGTQLEVHLMDVTDVLTVDHSPVSCCSFCTARKVSPVLTLLRGHADWNVTLTVSLTLYGVFSTSFVTEPKWLPATMQQRRLNNNDKEYQ